MDIVPAAETWRSKSNQASYTIPLSLNAVWIACHYQKKLGKREVVDADIKDAVSRIVEFAGVRRNSVVYYFSGFVSEGDWRPSRWRNAPVWQES